MENQSIAKRPKDFIKIIVVGDGAVGKTCMLMVYSNNDFPAGYIPTVFENYAVNMPICNRNYTISLFDTAGQEAFDRLRPLAYKGTDVFLVCYAVDSEASYSNVKVKWIPEVRHYNKDTPIIIVGTKTDLRDSVKHGCKILTEEQGKQLAKETNAYDYIECSALKNDNVKRVFDSAIYLSVQPKCAFSKEKHRDCSLM